MSKKNDKKEAQVEKLDPNEDIKLENLNFAIEREEIFTRMEMNGKELAKFKQ
jgi:hypothetical protein